MTATFAFHQVMPPQKEGGVLWLVEHMEGWLVCPPGTAADEAVWSEVSEVYLCPGCGAWQVEVQFGDRAGHEGWYGLNHAAADHADECPGLVALVGLGAT